MALLSHALTTVDRQKDFQGITGSSEDTILERLINAATDWIEKECGERRFKQTAYTQELYDGSGTTRLLTRQWPISSTETFTLERRDTIQNRNNWTAEDTECFKVDYNRGLVIFVGTRIFQDIPDKEVVWMDGQYEVLNPWVEADLRSLRGISPRIENLDGKKIGLFCNYKRAAPLIMSVVQNQLGERFPTAHFSEFQFGRNFAISETPEIKKLEDWLKGIDTVVAAVGD